VPEVGIIISANDRATSVMRTIGTVGQNSLEGIRGAANRAGDAFAAFGDAATRINQAMELGKKAVEIFRAVVADTVAVSLEFRRANDPASKSIRDMARDVQVLRARMGDVMIPILVGVAEGTNSITRQISDLIVENRVLIGTKLTEWMADLARILVVGVAAGFTVVSKAVTGVLEVVALVRAGFEKFYSFVLKGTSSLTSAFADLAGVFNDDMANALRSASTAQQEFADVLSESGDKNLAKVSELVAAQEAREEGIRSLKATVLDVIDRTEVAALEKVRQSTVGLGRTREDLDAAKEAREARAEEIFLRQMGRISRERAAVEMNTQLQLDLAAKLEAEQAVSLQRRNDLTQQVASATVDAWGAAAGQIISGNQRANEAIRAAVVNTAEKTIMAAAASGAAQAAFSQAGIPIIGPILATTAAGVMFAFIRKYMTEFQFGGVVKGSVPGKDSVPALLTPGERVLTQRERAEYEGRAPSGGSKSVNVSIQAPIQDPNQMSKEQIKRWFLNVAPVIEEVVSDGLAFRDFARSG